MRKMQVILITLFLLTVLVLPIAAAEPPTFTVNIVAENGTVRVFGTFNAASGLDRIEIKIDENSFRTADISGNTYEFTENITTTGQHVAVIRAFDYTGTASLPETKTFYAERKSSSTTDDISFFVRASSLKVTTFNSSRNVREMEHPEDFCIEFVINNDDTIPHKIRYRIDVNGEESTKDANVKRDNTYSVAEWYAADFLSVGQNRIKITLIDWETKEIIEENSVTINLKSNVKPTAEYTADEYPEWFKNIAEANNLFMPDTTKTQTIVQSNPELENEIFMLKTEVERLKANQTPPAAEKTFIEKNWFYLAAAVLIAGCFILYKNGKFDDFLKKKQDEEDEKLEPK